MSNSTQTFIYLATRTGAHNFSRFFRRHMLRYVKIHMLLRCARLCQTWSALMTDFMAPKDPFWTVCCASSIFGLKTLSAMVAPVEIFLVRKISYRTAVIKPWLDEPLRRTKISNISKIRTLEACISPAKADLAKRDPIASLYYHPLIVCKIWAESVGGG